MFLASATPFLFGAALLCAAGQPVEPTGAVGLSDPTLSPDGSTVVFVHRGDLWQVPVSRGRAQRLTTHVARETRPLFSPDGRWLAFSSNRWGNDDVFVMSAMGGEARRLTYHEVDEAVVDWDPSSESVLFAASRSPRESRIWIVSIDGGESRLRTRYAAHDASLSPDGTALICTAGSSRWWRWDYSGSAAARLILERAGSGPRVVLRSLFNDRWPVWTPDGASCIWASARSGGVPNLFRARLDGGGEVEQLTAEPAPGVAFPSVDGDCRFAVFERSGRLYRADLDGSRKVVPIPIDVVSDAKRNQIERVVTSSIEGAWDVDPAGKRVVASIRGELFLADVENEEGRHPRRLTHYAGRDDAARFAPNGEEIVFVSDRGGQADLWLLQVGEERQPGQAGIARRLTAGSADVHDPHWSADGELVLYRLGLNDYWVVSCQGGEPGLVIEGPQVYTPQWSPLGNWIAFERHNAGQMGDIWVVDIDSGETWNVTPDPAHDQSPRWSPDGRRLLFESDRDGSWDLFLLTMTEETEEENAASAKEGEGAERDSEEKKLTPHSPEAVAILEETRRFLRRGRFEPEKVASTAGDDHGAVFSPSGDEILFSSNAMGGWDLWRGALDGGKPKRLTQDGAEAFGIRWLQKERIFYRSGERIRSAHPDLTDMKVIDLEVRLNLDRRARDRAVFAEAWRALRESFYDPALHGADWDAVQERYSARLEGVWDREDLQRLISEMLGELHASHLGIWGGGPPNQIHLGYLGASLQSVDRDSHRAWRIEEIVANGPLDPIRPAAGESRPSVGDFIVIWNGRRPPAGALLDTLLLDQAGQKVDLGIARGKWKKGPDGHLCVELVGRGREAELRYDQWVETRRARVDSLGGGRIGYIHLQAMNSKNLRRFRQALMGDVYDRDALIIDVRNNGGGNIHEQLLRELDRLPYALAHPRGGRRSVQPANWRRRPAALLINERSGSDAEIFPEAFRTLGLGPLIGVTTAGAVIGTGGTRLLDGSWLRLPTVGWYTLDGRNMENSGVDPDLYVELTPADEVTRRDPQLDRAIEVLLEQVEHVDPGQESID
jgi:tricorn protease